MSVSFLIRSRKALNYSGLRNRSPAMAQTSITSFFSKSPNKPNNGNLKEPDATIKNNGVLLNGNINFDPSVDPYHPVNDACWKKGEKTPYLALARTFEVIEAESSRLAIIRTICNFFRSVMVLSPADLVRCLYLSLNRVGPAWEGLEVGVGQSIAVKALANATGKSSKVLQEEKDKEGDLGLVAAKSRNNQRTLKAPVSLTIEKVFGEFKKLTHITGASSQSAKVTLIQNLLVASKNVEAKYIIRALTGTMRIGLAEKSILTALAHAAVLCPPGQDLEDVQTKPKIAEDSFKQAEGIIKKAYNEYPNYDRIVEALLTGGFEQVQKICRIRPGIPVKPMLAHPSKGIEALLARLEHMEFVSEYKYDGERAQVHRTEEGKITVYSRNQEDHTGKFPDLIARIPTHPKANVTSFIIDAEVVAWDIEQKKILPFQILSTRKRKNVGSSKDVTVQVCLFAFDLLYLNGEPLVSMPLRVRRQMLRDNFTITNGEFMFATDLQSNDPDALQAFMSEATQNSCEGLMVKALDKPYEISKRSNSWLKLKKDYLDSIGDSVDVVVIGGYHGAGKRAGTYGSFLCAVYDPKNEEFQTLCKLATGLSDENLSEFKAFFDEHLTRGKGSQPLKSYRYTLVPDVWFNPVKVWEIKGADLSISPVHTAGLGLAQKDKGISLRFPRFIRERPDKKPEDATDGGVIFGMYKSQAVVQNLPNVDVESDDDY